MDLRCLGNHCYSMFNLPLLSPLLNDSLCSSDGRMKYIDDTFSSDSFWNCFYPQNKSKSGMGDVSGSQEDLHLDDTTDSISNAKSFKALLLSLHGRMELMAQNISFLQTEIECKNSTIDKLIDIVKKLAPCVNGDSTYNHNVDKYNKNVSDYNSTPKKTDNITTRKKKHVLPNELAEFDFEHLSSEEDVSTPTKDEHEAYVDQLAEYRKSKHTNFLISNEGKTWDGAAWKVTDLNNNVSPATNISCTDSTLVQENRTNDVMSVHDVLLDDDQDIEQWNNLYENWDGTSMESENSLAQLRRLYNEPLPPEAHWRKGTTLIIGDSMIGGLDETRLRNTKVRVKPGATIEDMFFQITPYLRKCPTNIICHVGTNNANKDKSDEIMEKLVKLKEYIMSRCPAANIVFSALIDRYDDNLAARVVQETNAKLKHLDTPLIDNNNIIRDHVGRRGLHLNNSGTTRLALNFITMLKQLSE